MEPVTHFLTGACLGRAGLNRRTALATLTTTLAAEAPDIDVLGRLKGDVFVFAHHRGFTHSFLGLLIVCAVVLGVVYLMWRLRGRKTKSGQRPRWGLLFLFAYLAGLSHLLLDYTNAYGVRPLWPFSERWHSWDIVSIVEPVLLLFLVAGLALPALSGLIDREMGVRRKLPRGKVAAILALSGMVLVWVVRDYEHRHAIASLQARNYEGADPLRVSAYPYMLDPFHWSGVVETRDFFATVLVDSSAAEVDPGGNMEIRYKPEETPVTLAAKKSYLGQVYLDWAAYPITETEQLDSGRTAFLVRFRDLRYIYPGESRRSVLSAWVSLDRQLRVLDEDMGVSRAPQ